MRVCGVLPDALSRRASWKVKPSLRHVLESPKGGDGGIDTENAPTAWLLSDQSSPLSAITKLSILLADR